MILFMEHDLLVTAEKFADAEKRVRLFFDKSQLVHYDFVDVDREKSCNAADQRFSEGIAAGIADNKRILAELLAKLQDEGCRELADLLALPQGFQSKMLHTMSHLLDGFFGIDSKLFDIDEISHWITPNRRSEIEENPGRCWLIRVEAKSVYGEGFEDTSS
jgi:hypothetical protein